MRPRDDSWSGSGQRIWFGYNEDARRNENLGMFNSILKDKLGTVLAVGDDDLNGVVGAHAPVILFEPFPQTVCFDTNDRVFFRVKIRRAAQSLESNTVLLNLIRPAFKVKPADI